jgi:putative ABC transport system ATP-binding protein
MALTETAVSSVPTRGVAARMLHATKVYGKNANRVLALDDVSVEFPSGVFTAIMGPSGSGKSTLLNCLAGLDRLSSGDVWIGGTELTRLREEQRTRLRRDHVGFVFQGFNLIPTLNAIENMRLPLALAGRTPDPQWEQQVVHAVGLDDRLHHRPTELSGGQQQRVAVGRALLSKPTLVFADEPTGNLDSRASAEVIGFLRDAVCDFGQTIVMVTHDPRAAAAADRVVFLADGRIVDELTSPTADAVLDRMRTLGS